MSPSASTIAVRVTGFDRRGEGYAATAYSARSGTAGPSRHDGG
jgi:hypothetical protein